MSQDFFETTLNQRHNFGGINMTDRAYTSSYIKDLIFHQQLFSTMCKITHPVIFGGVL